MIYDNPVNLVCAFDYLELKTCYFCIWLRAFPYLSDPKVCLSRHIKYVTSLVHSWDYSIIEIGVSCEHIICKGLFQGIFISRPIIFHFKLIQLLLITAIVAHESLYRPITFLGGQFHSRHNDCFHTTAKCVIWIWIRNAHFELKFERR